MLTRETTFAPADSTRRRPRGWRAAAAGAVALGLVVTLAGCGSDDSSAQATSAAATAAPSPTALPDDVVWAGEVCEDRDNLKAAVGALGRNLDYDISSDKSALEQIDRQLRIQVLAVGDAISRLGTTLQGVPVDFQEANDLVVKTTKAKDDTTEALAQAQEHLNAMVSADNILAGVAEAGKALASAKAAFEAGTALVGAVQDGVASAGGQVQEAFDAAPQCQGDAG